MTGMAPAAWARLPLLAGAALLSACDGAADNAPLPPATVAEEQALKDAEAMLAPRGRGAAPAQTRSGETP